MTQPDLSPLSFLDPEISVWIDHHRKCNPDWFGLSDRLIRIHGRAIEQVSANDRDESRCLAALLYLRGVSSLQGAIILAERGLTSEARTVVRSLFEAIFYFGALKNDPTFYRAMRTDEISRKKKIAKVWLSVSDMASKADAEMAQALSNFLSDPAANDVSLREIRIIEAARAADLIPIYETYYRSLSNDGAHPSMSSLMRHFDRTPKTAGEVFRFGPDANDVADCITIVCVAGIYLFQIAEELFGFDEPTNVCFRDTWNLYVNLSSHM